MVLGIGGSNCDMDNCTLDELLDSIARFTLRVENNCCGYSSAVKQKASEHQSAEPKLAPVGSKEVDKNKASSKKKRERRKRGNRNKSLNRSKDPNQGKESSTTKSKKERKQKRNYPSLLHSWKVTHTTTIVRFHPGDRQHLESHRKQCTFCLTSFRSDRVLQHHLERSHGDRFDLSPLLTIDNRNHSIAQRVLAVELEQLPRADTRFHLKITNQTNVTLLLKSVHVFDGIDSLEPIFAPDGGGALRMTSGYFHEDEMVLEERSSSSIEDCVFSLLITVEPMDDERPSYDIVEQYHFNRTTKNIRIDGTPLKFTRLPSCSIPEAIRILHHNNFSKRPSYGAHERQILQQFEEAKKPSSLSIDNHRKQLSLLNRIEVEHVRCEFEGYTIERPTFKRVRKVKTLKDGSKREQILITLSIDQFKNRPSMIDEDVYVFVTVQMLQRVECYTGTVEYVEPTMILMLMGAAFPMSGNAVKIEFHFNRIPYQLEQQAMSLLSQCRKETILFPSGVGREPLQEITSFQWIRTNIATNEEQMVAVRNIVNRTSFPAPYVLFGPPGTGKSSTLVEAVGQIYRLRPTANILVVAPSNFAANEITSRLLVNMPQNSVYRFFSKRCLRKVDDIDGGILEVSNLIDKEFDVPCYEDIYFARVVVATMATAGRLVQARIADKHFSYVIIDECGSAKEISALVPIAELATSGDEIHGSIVLAGDPKQLGPVIQYDYLKQTNHSTSLLERIMKLDLYSMDPTTKEYDTRVITQLRDSFRSHAKLLQFSNSMFYDGLLRAKAPPEITDWALGWKLLPNPKCPLIFCSIIGKIKQDDYSFSLYNVEEAEIVLIYVKEILTNGINGRKIEQSEIGIISPYARQVLHFRELCKAQNWSEIEIGSAEQYQGREKEIIIISTVRTRCNHVGFLSDVKRLNVMLTRAKALMIVVGDASTLLSNAHWRKFIKYCRVNKAYIDMNQPIAPKDSSEQKETGKSGKARKSESRKNRKYSKKLKTSPEDKNSEEQKKMENSEISNKSKNLKKSKKPKTPKESGNSKKQKKSKSSEKPPGRELGQPAEAATASSSH